MNEKCKWGIPEINFIDEEYGEVKVRAFGLFSYQIINQEQFNIAFNNEKNNNESLEVEEFTRTFIVRIITEHIKNNESKKVLELPISINKDVILQNANQHVNGFGFAYTEISIGGIKILPESMKKIEEIDMKKIMQSFPEFKPPVTENNNNNSSSTANTQDNNVTLEKSGNNKKSLSQIIIGILILIVCLIALFLKG